MTLKVEHVTAGYGHESPVIRDINFEVEQGEILSVLGPSGSGKTTLLRVVAGLHPADSGAINLEGRDVTALAPEKRRIALVPQEGALFPHLDVASNIGYGLQGRGYGSLGTQGERESRIADLLDLIGLAGLGERMPQQLSGGQQQRVALARALAPQPNAVLLDEPFSSLDSHLRLEVRSQVVELLREAAVPAVLITHDQDEAMSVSDTIAVLHEGVVEQIGTPREVYLTPRNRVVAKATGDCVIVDGKVFGWDSGEVLIRPEQFVLTTLDQSNSDDQAARSPSGGAGTIQAVTYRGREQLVQIDLDSGVQITADVDATNSWVKGDRAFVSVQGPVHALDS